MEPATVAWPTAHPNVGKGIRIALFQIKLSEQISKTRLEYVGGDSDSDSDSDCKERRRTSRPPSYGDGRSFLDRMVLRLRIHFWAMNDSAIRLSDSANSEQQETLLSVD